MLRVPSFEVFSLTLELARAQQGGEPFAFRFDRLQSLLRQEVQSLQARKKYKRVVLTLRSAAAELYSLPWELLTIKASGQHLAELPDVLIRDEWPGTSTTPEPASPSSSQGRVLRRWSAAAGAVSVAESLAAIQEASETNRLRDCFRNCTPCEHWALCRLLESLASGSLTAIAHVEERVRHQSLRESEALFIAALGP